MQRVPEDKGVALPYYFSMRNALPLLTVAVLLSGPLAAQTRPAPSLDAVASVRSGRPIPGPVYEIPAFSRAVDRGTRTRGGTPGAKHWTQYARYSIEATLDARQRARGVSQQLS